MNPDELLQLMKDRRSVRMFESTPIPEESLMKILEAARWCQSASNRQPWRFIVIRNHELIEKIAKHATYGKFISQAPLLIAIVADKKGAPNWYIHDTSMVSHQICLMTWALGLGTCWIGSLDRDKAGSLLNLKSNEFLTTVLPIGVPKTKGIGTSSRKELTDLISYLD
jgi:nitroreductase